MSFIDKSKEQTRSPFRVVDLGLDNPLSLIDVTPLAWWDAKDSGTVLLEGSNVTEWLDKSGNGHHLAQTTVSKQPTYASNAITFDGTHAQLLKDDVINDGPNTVFAVYKPAAGYGETSYIIGNQGSGISKTRFYIKSREVDFGNTALPHNLDNAGENILVTAWVNDSGDGSTQRVKINSSSYFSGSVDRGVTNNDISIGSFRSGTAHFKGEIKEIMIFDYEMSFNHRTMMEIKLMEKWGI